MLIRLILLALPLNVLALPHAQQDDDQDSSIEIDTSEVSIPPFNQIVPSSYAPTALRGGLAGEHLTSEASEDAEGEVSEGMNEVAASHNADSETNDAESLTDLFAIPEISSVVNVRDDDFLKIVGKNPMIEMAARRGKGRAATSRVPAVAGLPDKHFAFEAGAWDPIRNDVWFTSNINIGYSTVHVLNLDSNVVRKPKLSQAVTNPNGGIYFDGKVYLCAFGNRTAPHGIYSIEPGSGVVNKIVDNYDGRSLNSPDDVAFLSKTGADGRIRTSMFFTDPAYGALWGVSDQPQLRNGVYRYDFESRRIARVLGDDPITDPNGVCVDVTQTKVYVTNTPGTIQGRDIWVYDLDERWNLVNPQLFGTAEVGVPDGIKCDNFGNVWTGEGGGIVVRNSRGKILGQFNAGPLTQGKSLLTKDMANFGLAGDTLVVLGLDVIWKIKLAMPMVTADRYKVGGLPVTTH